MSLDLTSALCNSQEEIHHLPQTFTCLVPLFLLTDVLNTTGFLFGIIRNQLVTFSVLKITYLNFTQAAASITSTFDFIYIWKYFCFKAKYISIAKTPLAYSDLYMVR